MSMPHLYYMKLWQCRGIFHLAIAWQLIAVARVIKGLGVDTGIYACRIVRGCRLFSMTSQQYLCAACPSATKPRERRDLNSEASVRFSSSLATFICEKELTAVWESYQNKRYVCISCVKAIEKFSKLQSELKSLETMISDNMKRRAESCTTGARESQIQSRFQINLV